jgi:YVTN family beta-propeller protein
MDNITAMQSDIEVRPDPSKQVNGKLPDPGKQTNDKRSNSSEQASGYVANGYAGMAVINTASNIVIATIPVGNDPRGVAASPDGSKVKPTFTRFIEYGPIVLTVVAGLSLTCGVGIVRYVGPSQTLDDLMSQLGTLRTLALTFCSLGWVISMGCIGGIASLGMQAIEVPEGNPAIDISNRQLAILRVVLGGLFALVLTFAFESDCFIDICHRIAWGREFVGDQESPLFRAFVLMLPFMLGFSTLLVTMVINQLNAGALIFFGRLGPASDTKVAASPATAGQAGQK